MALLLLEGCHCGINPDRNERDLPVVVQRHPVRARTCREFWQLFVKLRIYFSSCETNLPSSASGKGLARLKSVV